MDRRNFLKLSGVLCGASMMSPLTFSQGYKKLLGNTDFIKNTSIELQKYIEENSLTHQVVFPDHLPCGAVANYMSDKDDIVIDDFTVIVKKNGGNLFLTGRESIWSSYLGEETFFAPTWNHAIYQHTPYKFITETFDNERKDEAYTDTMPKTVFDSLKKKFLNQQEQLFMELVKYATQKAGTYFKISKSEQEEDHAFWLAVNQKYTNAWVGSKFKDDFLIKQMWNKSTLYSDNLNGILLSNEDEPINNGIITLRQDPCILPSVSTKEYVAYEDIAMSVIGKNLTYIEIA